GGAVAAIVVLIAAGTVAVVVTQLNGKRQPVVLGSDRSSSTSAADPGSRSSAVSSSSEVAVHQGVLLVTIDPADGAEATVDGEKIAELKSKEASRVELKEGEHTLRVVSEGFLPVTRTVNIHDDGKE